MERHDGWPSGLVGIKMTACPKSLQISHIGESEI